jgi:hypothetical protein
VISVPVPAIQELGLGLEQLWRAQEYSPAVFPKLASEALFAARLPERVTLEGIVETIFAAEGSVLRQEDPAAAFGQPPVTLFRAPRFYIDALFWVDGTTSIHQHGFSGAFGVLTGSSIETRFGFEVEREIDGLFKLGALQVLSTALLRPGDVRPILSGARLIHSLFHLERPTISIVVRTYRDADAGPQFEFARPGVAHDPFFGDHARDRAMQLVKMLRTVEHPQFEQLVGDLVARSDLHTAYRILRDCVSLPNREMVDRLVQRLRDGDVGERLQRSFEQTRRLNFLHSRRALVKDPELRFLLGVLLNSLTRRDALQLVSSRVPAERPERTVAGWLRRLSTVTAKLQVGGTAWEPNLLGLPPFDDRLEQAVEAVLAGGTIPSDDPARPLLDQLRALPGLSCLWS